MAHDKKVRGGKLPLILTRGIGQSRSEEHTSELQSLMRISYAVFCLKKKTNTANNIQVTITLYIPIQYSHLPHHTVQNKTITHYTMTLYITANRYIIYQP